MLQRHFGRVGALACIFATTVAAAPAQAAETATTLTEPVIVSPADGTSIPGRFTGPYTIDMTGAPAGTWRGTLNCAVPEDEDPFAIELGNFTWDGSADPIRTFTAAAVPTTATSCNWNVKPSISESWRYDAWSQFAVTPSPDPRPTAPRAGAVLPNGNTGPFTVDLTAALPGTYQSSIGCYSNRWDYRADLPQITWDGTTDPVRSFTLATPMPTAPSCYWTVYRTTQDDYRYEVYGRVDFSVDAPPVTISGVDQRPATFYPLVRDGYRDATTTSFTLSRPSLVTAQVIDAAGRTILTRALSYRRLAAGAHAWKWNGKRDDGTRATAGSYRIRLRAKDSRAHHATARTSVKVATKIVTRTGSRIVAGSTGARSARPGCSVVRSGGLMHLDCYGGRAARARYAFAVPATTYTTSFEVRGYAPAADICCDGRITKTATRPSKRTYAVVVKVSGWRAYNVRSVTATWKYRKRI